MWLFQHPLKSAGFGLAVFWHTWEELHFALSVAVSSSSKEGWFGLAVKSFALSVAVSASSEECQFGLAVLEHK